MISRIGRSIIQGLSPGRNRCSSALTFTHYRLDIMASNIISFFGVFVLAASVAALPAFPVRSASNTHRSVGKQESAVECSLTSGKLVVQTGVRQVVPRCRISYTPAYVLLHGGLDHLYKSGINDVIAPRSSSMVLLQPSRSFQ
jgi:hypothetical protein